MHDYLNLVESERAVIEVVLQLLHHLSAMIVY